MIYMVDIIIIFEVQVFFDEMINIISYIVKDFISFFVVIIDSVMDIDYVVGCIIFEYVDELIWQIEI